MKAFVYSLLALVFCSIDSSVQQDCPVSIRDGDKVPCYFTNFAFNNWENTRRTCRIFSPKNGGLAKLNTKEKLQAVLSNRDYFLRGELSVSYWMGLKYVASTKTFYWNDGTKLEKGDYQNWAVGDSEVRSGVENCVSINLYTAMAKNASGDLGKWHIDDCLAPRAGLCETTIPKEQKSPKLSELVAFYPEKAAIYFEKQPVGTSCTHGVILFRHKKEPVCSQHCLVENSCAGYIVPKNSTDCILKSNTCRMTFADKSNTFYKKITRPDFML